MQALELINQIEIVNNLPTTLAFGSDNTFGLQLLALLNEEIAELTRKHPWQECLKLHTHTAVAGEDQGTLPADLDYIIQSTFTNKATRFRSSGSVPAQDWVDYQVNLKPTSDTFTIIGGHLFVTPAPQPGDEYIYMYKVKPQYVALATDEIILPSDLVRAGLRWRWAREKGLAYAELFASYEWMVKDAIGRNVPRMSLSVSGCPVDVRLSGWKVL